MFFARAETRVPALLHQAFAPHHASASQAPTAKACKEESMRVYDCKRAQACQ